MSFDRTRAHEVENGVVLNDGAGIFYDASVPSVTGNEVAGDRFIDSQGRKWRFIANGWVLDQNFTVREISANEVVEIQSKEEMLVTKPIVNRGLLINRGHIRHPNLSPLPPAPFVQADRFSYYSIEPSQIVLILSGQIMVTDRLIENRGHLINRGRILSVPVVDVSEINGFPYETIEQNEIVKVKSRQQMLLKGILRNKGQLINRGRVVLL